jgi:hypothetical protein
VWMNSPALRPGKTKAKKKKVLDSPNVVICKIKNKNCRKTRKETIFTRFNAQGKTKMIFHNRTELKIH